MSKPSEGDLVVSGSELWQAFGAISTQPTIKIFNPGLAGLPRLDGFAQMYDEYRIVKCRLEYKTTAASTSPGTVIVAVDYDTVRQPTTLSGLTPIQPQLRTQVWKGGTVTVDPQRANKQFWLRTSNASSTDTGAFAACIANLGTADCGELWIHYTVRFTNPRSQTQQYLVSCSQAGVYNVAAANLGDTTVGIANRLDGTNHTAYPWVTGPGNYFLTIANIPDDQITPLVTSAKNWWTQWQIPYDITSVGNTVLAVILANTLRTPLISTLGQVTGMFAPAARQIINGWVQASDRTSTVSLLRLAPGDWAGASGTRTAMAFGPAHTQPLEPVGPTPLSGQDDSDDDSVEVVRSVASQRRK
jgi:hypothetical protein